MFCIFCGKELKDESKFCPYCGGEQIAKKTQSVLQKSSVSNLRPLIIDLSIVSGVIVIGVIITLIATGVFSKKDSTGNSSNNQIIESTTAMKETTTEVTVITEIPATTEVLA